MNNQDTWQNHVFALDNRTWDVEAIRPRLENLHQNGFGHFQMTQPDRRLEAGPAAGESLA